MKALVPDIKKQDPDYRVPADSSEIPGDILDKIEILAGALIRAKVEPDKVAGAKLVYDSWQKLAEQEIVILTGPERNYQAFLWYADNLFNDVGASARLCSPAEINTCKRAIIESDYDVIWSAAKKEPLKILSAASEDIYCKPRDPAIKVEVDKANALEQQSQPSTPSYASAGMAF